MSEFVAGLDNAHTHAIEEVEDIISTPFVNLGSKVAKQASKATSKVAQYGPSPVSTFFGSVSKFFSYKNQSAKKDLADYSLLSEAIDNIDIKQVARLLKKKDLDLDYIDHFGVTALHSAAEKGNAQLLNVLLNSPGIADRVNSYYFDEMTDSDITPLHEAAMAGSIQCCNLLLRAGALTNQDMLRGHSPLHFALTCGSLKCAELFLKQGCKVETVDFMQSCMFGKKTVVKFLVDHHVDVLVADEHHNNTLHHLARTGNCDMSSHILEMKPELLHTLNDRKETPLHLAVIYDHIEMVKLLLEKGARKNVKDIEGNTAEDIARRKNSIDMLSLF